MNAKATGISAEKQSYPWLKRLALPLKSYYREDFVISLFTNLLALAVPLFTLQVYDRVVSHNATATLVALSIGVVLALVFDFILRQSRSRLLQNVALHIDAKLGRLLYAKLTTLPLRTLEERPSSYWQGVFSDIMAIRAVLSGPTAIMLLDIPFAVLFLAVLFLIAPSIAWLLFLIIPAFLALTYFSSKYQTALSAKETKHQQSREALLSELIAGRTTVKALMIDKAMQEEFETLHADSIRQSFSRGSLADNFIALGGSLSQLTTVIMVIAGALAIIDRDLTIGALIATTMLTGRIIMPLNQLLSTWKQFASARESAQRLEKLFAEQGERDAPAIERERPRGELTLEHVSYSYRKDTTPAVRDLAFKVGPGHVVGIVGRNGCGKTTLIKLMLGLYSPDKGRVLLDEADIKQFSRAELSEWIGYVPQECFLFAGTIKQNIAKAHPTASDEAILNAARLAGADQFVINLPEGYDTQIGERGYTLSGGQRQRIAIARALLRNPPVLLLDEVSNHLDSDAERALIATLQDLKAERCIIIVTHSPSLLKSCDRIVVMDKGMVAMAGPSADILSQISTGGTA
ncbi:MAG: peptidase domain-containing ABC transporter [Alphaproteobacteria bacterium]|nr:peptidase domain-containing ABC transporter [Alphaproteobacteria bacterium]